jgi:hypothetical protein
MSVEHAVHIVASDEGANLEGNSDGRDPLGLSEEEEELLERGLGQMPSLRDLTVRTLPPVPPRGASPLVFAPPCCP